MRTREAGYAIADDKVQEVFARIQNGDIVQIDISDTMVDFNFTGRISTQYNSGKWFAGALANINHYRYRNGSISFHTDNTFWNVRLFTGLRF